MFFVFFAGGESATTACKQNGESLILDLTHYSLERGGNGNTRPPWLYGWWEKVREGRGKGQNFHVLLPLFGCKAPRETAPSKLSNKFYIVQGKQTGTFLRILTRRLTLGLPARVLLYVRLTFRSPPPPLPPAPPPPPEFMPTVPPLPPTPPPVGAPCSSKPPPDAMEVMIHDSDERQRMGICRRLSWNSSGRSCRGIT